MAAKHLRDVSSHLQTGCAQRLWPPLLQACTRNMLMHLSEESLLACWPCVRGAVQIQALAAFILGAHACSRCDREQAGSKQRPTELLKGSASIRLLTVTSAHLSPLLAAARWAPCQRRSCLQPWQACRRTAALQTRSSSAAAPAPACPAASALAPLHYRQHSAACE